MRPLGGEPEEMQRLVAELASGNLASSFTVDPKIGRTFFSVSELQSNLSSLVGVVRCNTESVSNASAQISQGNIDLSERTEQQNFSTQKAASSMEELSSTVTKSSENATRTNDLAVEASQVASRGSDVVSQVLETMQQVMGSIHEMTAIMGEISRASSEQSIGVRQVGEEMNDMDNATRQTPPGWKKVLRQPRSYVVNLNGYCKLWMHFNCLSYKRLCAPLWRTVKDLLS